MKPYMLSRYNFFFTVDGEDYIYNSFSGALSKLDKGNKDRLINFDNYEGEIDEFYAAAIKNGYIVRSDADELAILNYMRTNSICQDKNTCYEILTTTACNARCAYCFEEGVKCVTMSKETAEQVCRFIVERNRNAQSVLIQWFGGEPLLNQEVITYITSTLDRELAEKGVKIKYQMTTNGSLITEGVVKRIKEEWHIGRVQITLDGTKNVYEARKAYINIPNAFERVIKNINMLADEEVRVGIRLNYDSGNIDNIFELIDYLNVAISNKNYVMVYAYPIFGDDPASAPDVRETALKLIKINSKISEYGLSHARDPFNLHFVTTKCYACLRHSCLIYPDGRLGKCSTAMKDGDFFGDVFSPIRLNTNFLKWCSTELPSPECSKCKFLPLCQGGCKAGHLGYTTVQHYIYRNCFEEILTEIVRFNQNKK